MAAPVEVFDNEKRLSFFAEYFDYDESYFNGFEFEDVLVHVEMINSAPNDQSDKDASSCNGKSRELTMQQKKFYSSVIKLRMFLEFIFPF